MPSCPVCETDYPTGTAVCLKDGARLSAAPAASGGGAVAAGGAAAAVAREIASAPTLPELAASSAPASPAPASSPPESFDPLVGASLAGRYTIVRRIGEGGM